jgi:hypothetical protein
MDVISALAGGKQETQEATKASEYPGRFEEYSREARAVLLSMNNTQHTRLRIPTTTP